MKLYILSAIFLIFSNSFQVKGMEQDRHNVFSPLANDTLELILCNVIGIPTSTFVRQEVKNYMISLSKSFRLLSCVDTFFNTRLKEKYKKSDASNQRVLCTSDLFTLSDDFIFQCFKASYNEAEEGVFLVKLLIEKKRDLSVFTLYLEISSKKSQNPFFFDEFPHLLSLEMRLKKLEIQINDLKNALSKEKKMFYFLDLFFQYCMKKDGENLVVHFMNTKNKYGVKRRKQIPADGLVVTIPFTEDSVVIQDILKGMYSDH
jgi:hypothetical protein